MGFLADVGSVVGIAKGVMGLFGGGNDAPTPSQNLLSQAKGAREAAEKYGFNPLTMLQYGQPGGALGAGGGVPPLASIGLIMDGLQALDPETKAEQERQRQADQLNLDLARLKLEQARSGVVVGAMGAADSLGGPSPLGRKAMTIAPGASAPSLSVRPVPRPTFDSAGTIPVFNLSGGLMQMNKRVADRLQLKPFDVVTGEDAEGVAGEVGGNVLTVPHLANVPGIFGGVGDPFQQSRSSKKLDPAIYGGGLVQRFYEYFR